MGVGVEGTIETTTMCGQGCADSGAEADRSTGTGTADTAATMETEQGEAEEEEEQEKAFPHGSCCLQHDASRFRTIMWRWHHQTFSYI